MTVDLLKKKHTMSRSIIGKISLLLGGRTGLGRAGASMVAGVAAAVLFVGLFYVWSRMQVVQIGYDIASLEKTNKELKKRKRELMLELASLESPEVLERKARDKAGLVFPSIDKVVHVP